MTDLWIIGTHRTVTRHCMLLVCCRLMQCLHFSCAILYTTVMRCSCMIHDDDFVNVDTKIPYYFYILLVSLLGLKCKYLLQFPCFKVINAVVVMSSTFKDMRVESGLIKLQNGAVNPKYTSSHEKWAMLLSAIILAILEWFLCFL